MLQASVLSALPLELLQRIFLVAAVGGSLLLARWLQSATGGSAEGAGAGERAGGDRRWGDVLRRRFVLGVPWGTLLVVLGVLLVYWVVQGGWAHPRDPMVIPFRSWSYFYPLGVAVAGFAHNGVGHLTGNLLGTIVFAPIVEYVVGHYPDERGSESFSSLRTNPYVRILFVPAASLLVGLFTGVFSLGPAIGFSGVLFAYQGFAVVTRPILAVFALLSARVVDLFYNSLRNPYLTREAQQAFVTPWWSDVAIQGHAIGILLGAVLGIALLRRRAESPDALSLWFAAVVFGVSGNLWAIYRPIGASRFALYRAVGIGLLFVFAAVVTVAVTSSKRPISPAIDVAPRDAGVQALVVLLVATSAMAVPFGFTTVEGDLPQDAETIEVRDYTVTYVEGEPNQYVPSYNVSVSAFGRTLAIDTREATNVRSSGVVVLSEERRVWLEAVSKGRLAFQGGGTVRVGGLGWRDQVYARRSGWSLRGNGSAYKVYLRRDGERRRLAYRTEPVVAAPTVAGRNVAIRPMAQGFDVLVRRGNVTLGSAPMPSASNETRIGGLTLNRSGRTLFAVRNETRVQVAQRAVPAARQN